MSVEKLIVTKEDNGFTMLSNHVLQNLTNVEALGLWVYLASLPPAWEFYKQHIQTHFKFGRDRLNKLFKYLADRNLIELCTVRNEKGQFAHISVHVKNGNSFKNIDITPCTEKPYTANQSPVNSSYKDINTKKKENKQRKLLSASDNAQDRFEDFWKAYPLKKNKKRSQMIWKRQKLNEKVNQILEDIEKRAKLDHQWRNKQYIPHPSTYLNGEIWNDDIVKHESMPEKRNYRPVETRSTVKEWCKGNPDYDRLHGY